MRLFPKVVLNFCPRLYFQENPSDISDEQEEGFHQDIRTMEERYEGCCDSYMMADYCWTLIRDCTEKAIGGNHTSKLFF